jgi:hypothetical protein
LKLLALSVSLAAVVIGLVIAVGARRKWRVLLNPPKRLWIIPLWPYALMTNRRFNSKFFATYHFVSGIIFVVIGLAMFILILLHKT